MTSQPRQRNAIMAEAMADLPTPAQAKSRLIAWAEERDLATASTGGWTPLGTAMRVGLPALAGFALLRALVPSRGRAASGSRPAKLIAGLLRLAFLIRTCAWLLPVVAKAAGRLKGPSVSK